MNLDTNLIKPLIGLPSWHSSIPSLIAEIKHLDYKVVFLPSHEEEKPVKEKTLFLFTNRRSVIEDWKVYSSEEVKF